MIANTYLILCVTLGIVFVYAGLAKIRTFEIFQLAIEEYDFIPEGTVRVLCIGIVSIECIIGLALLVGFFTNLVLIACLTLSAAFVGVSHLGKKSNKSSACFCFGYDGVLANSWKSIIRTGLILVGSIVALIIWYSSPEFEPALISVEMALIAVVLLLLISWLSDLPDLLFVSR